MFISLFLLACFSPFQEILAEPLPWTELPKLQLKSRSIENASELLRRRSLRPVNLPLKDYFNGTDLQWFGDITVGTPPQHFTVVFDSGSTDLLIPGVACGALCARQRRFDPAKSSTYIDLGDGEFIQFSTGVGVDPVEGDNWVVIFEDSKDTVSVAGLSAKNTSLGLIFNQTATFAPDPFDGIMGLGSSLEEGTWFSNMAKQGLPAKFGLYVTPKKAGHAELTLGGVDHTKLHTPMIFAPLPFSGGGWVLPSPGINVNGKTVPVLQTNRQISFDSGTSSLAFSKETTEAIYSIISPDIKPHGEFGAYGILCHKIPSLSARLDIQLTDESGKPFNLTIPSSELSVGPFRDDPTICQTFINALFFDIVGGSLLKHYYTLWDIEGSRLGFAPILNY